MATSAEATQGRPPLALIWKDVILPPSETFIRNQAEALRRWEFQLVGTKRAWSTLSRPEDVVIFGDTVNDRIRRRLARTSTIRRAVLRKNRSSVPDIVHAHFLNCGWSGAHLAEALGRPLIVTAHGRDVTANVIGQSPSAKKARKQALFVFSRASRVIAVSDFIAARLIELGAPPEKVVVHHIGIPIPPKPTTAQSKLWDIAFVGRFTQKKAPLSVLRAVSLLPESMSARCVMIGDGPLLDEAKRFAETHGLDVTFLGTVAPNIVAETLARSKILAAPSQTALDGDSEGLPIGILEAAAAGVPVVATQHAGIPDAVVSGRTGLLAAEKDDAQLAVNIQRLLANPSLAEEYGRAGRELVERHFDIATQTAILEAVYDQILSEWTASRSSRSRVADTAASAE